MPTERDRQKVRRPLSPKVLEDIGILGSFPATENGYKADGDWTHRYRIWLNHGYYGLMNLDGGFLRIGRKAGSGDTFTLSIVQTFVNWEGIVQTVTAEITCAADEIASPVSWTVTSEFHDADNQPMPRLALSQSGRMETQNAHITTNGSSEVIRTSNRLTGDWCLFEAVQRLNLNDNDTVAFDMLELMSALKPDHELRKIDGRAERPSFFAGELTRYLQTGRGVLPWEYWVDGKGRLVLATSGDRAYILDEEAEDRFAREVNKHREGGYSWKNQL